MTLNRGPASGPTRFRFGRAPASPGWQAHPWPRYRFEARAVARTTIARALARDEVQASAGARSAFTSLLLLWWSGSRLAAAAAAHGGFRRTPHCFDPLVVGELAAPALGEWAQPPVRSSCARRCRIGALAEPSCSCRRSRLPADTSRRAPGSVLKPASRSPGRAGRWPRLDDRRIDAPEKGGHGERKTRSLHRPRGPKQGRGATPADLSAGTRISSLQQQGSKEASTTPSPMIARAARPRRRARSSFT